MSSYKLTYFNLTGRGEPIRFLLSYAGVAFEDNRISFTDWPELKPKTPLEQIPILEVDGQTLFQTLSIARFLAKRFNLNGSNEFEAFEVDAHLETVGDLMHTLSTWFFNSDAEQKSAKQEETMKKVAFYLGKIEEVVKKNGGHFVRGKVSAADVVFAGFSGFLLHMYGKDSLAEYPGLKGVVDEVVAQPGVKSYLEKSPKTDL